MCVVALGWTHTAGTESSLFLIQLLVRARQLHFLAYRHTRSFAIATFEGEKVNRVSDCLTSAQPRSVADAHHQSTLRCVLAPRHAGIICSSSNDAVGLDPGGAGAVTAYILAADLLKSPPIIHRRFAF